MSNQICSILYYPGQSKVGCMLSHAELEFKGVSYNFLCATQFETELTQRIEKAKQGGLPFQRFCLELTPDQSEHLTQILINEAAPLLATLARRYHLNPEEQTEAARKFVERFFGPENAEQVINAKINSMLPHSWTCMDSISNILAKAGILRVPPIVKLSPLLSSLYLHALAYSSNSVGEIINYGSTFSSFRNCFVVNACRVGEITAIAVPILATGYLGNRVLSHVMTHFSF